MNYTKKKIPLLSQSLILPSTDVDDDTYCQFWNRSIVLSKKIS